MEAFLIALESSPELWKKRAVIERFDAASKFTEHAIASALYRVRAANVGALRTWMEDDLSFLDPQQRDSLIEAAAGERVEELRYLAPQQYAYIPDYLLFAFQNVPTRDLEEWITFFESDVGQWFTNTRFEATRAAYEPVFEKLGSTSAQLLLQEKETSEKEDPEIEFFEMDDVIEMREDSSIVDAQNVFVVVDEMPELIGGIASVQEQIVYPAEAKEAGVEGRVFVQFVVDEQGLPVDVQVLRELGFGCDEEAIRVIRMARFKPGKHQGEVVKVRYVLPIVFDLEEE